jgi:hypothetical protein
LPAFKTRSVVGGRYGCDVEAGSLAGSSSNEGKHASSVDRKEFHCNDMNGTGGKWVGVDCEYPWMRGTLVARLDLFHCRTAGGGCDDNTELTWYTVDAENAPRQ